MSTLPRTLALIALLGGSCAVVACGSSDAADGGDSSGSSGVGGFYTSASGGSGSVTTTGNGGSAGRNPIPFDYAHLCGDGCVPETGVASTTPCDLGGTTTATAGVGGAGNGATGVGGGTTTGGGAGPDPSNGDCKLVIDTMGVASGMCMPHGDNTETCFDSTDCAPGYGCVGDPGECRAYCCGAVSACPANTYCAERQPAPNDLPTNNLKSVRIPVCELATQCSLLTAGACEPGKTCSIVRTDGTTSCIPEGSGAAGEPCPCEADHVCSYSLNKCFKLCTLDASDCPAGSSCQGQGAEYPMDIGICVTTG